MSYIGMGADTALVTKLFYILDADSSGTVSYKEFVSGL